MKVCVGPVAAASARAWTRWAREMLGALRIGPTATGVLRPKVLHDVGTYVDAWAAAADKDGDGEFRWCAEVSVDELVYLTNSLYNLDQCLADLIRRQPGKAEPAEGHLFHVVLVEALLFALAEEGPVEAAFADQLRPWLAEPV